MLALLVLAAFMWVAFVISKKVKANRDRGQAADALLTQEELYAKRLAQYEIDVQKYNRKVDAFQWQQSVYKAANINSSALPPRPPKPPRM
jgi:uncharacterized membrane protein